MPSSIRESDAHEVRHATDASERILDGVAAAAQTSTMRLPSGRLIDVASRVDHDAVRLRSGDGTLLIELELTDSGVRLVCREAELELSAAQRLTLAAPEIAVDAERSLKLASGGTRYDRVAEDYHASVGGHARIEGDRVEMQANAEHVALRAAGRVALDGEHIGLNDDPCPAPFDWTRAAADCEEAT